ncbi:hypothetical protein Patl1_04301 [Pistacia atlantica]|uniref:Uncharacterized protein n=1 Tax=Pistacia atlantica TaxID=434234 RepID=A0ACC1BRF9_9ROSI|nr:hypothetical protein Patl1_04301 [Pistacia atlantica]
MMQFYVVVQIIFVLDCRCCEYALLILEHWPDALEIQRSVDLYEDFIRCCVADAMSDMLLLLFVIEVDKCHLPLMSQLLPTFLGFERSLESVLHASKQKATAIESMLRGLEISEKQNPSGPPVFTSPVRPAAVPFWTSPATP